MHNYWRQCGYGLLDKTADGHLVVTDAFLRSLLERPELAPVAESCAGELALHHALLDHPRSEVAPAQLAAHFTHPNGWWRDTAQRLLILKQDKSIVPALEQMVRTSGSQDSTAAQALLAHARGMDSESRQALQMFGAGGSGAVSHSPAVRPSWPWPWCASNDRSDATARACKPLSNAGSTWSRSSTRAETVSS